MSSHDITMKLLSDPLHKEIFSGHHSKDIYLVGGYIRDLFMMREGPDRDFVVCGDLHGVVSDINRRLKGNLIMIGKRGLARIILEMGTVLDFTPGKRSIKSDLSQRDFTMNALAWNPSTGIIDAYKGIEDIRSRIIRIISEANLKRDPVRILRAYRFAGDLCFSLEPQTQSSLISLKRLLLKAKSERITLEFFRILVSENASKTLEELSECGIINTLLPLYNKKLYFKVQEIDKLFEIIKKLPLTFRSRYKEIYSQDLTGFGLLIIEFLDQTRDLGLLCLGRNIRRRLERMRIANNMKTMMLRKRGLDELSLLYKLFSFLQEACLDFLIINKMERFIPQLIRFESIKKKRLISSAGIMKVAQIGEGKDIGRLKEAVQRAHFLGEIASTADARKLVRSIV